MNERNLVFLLNKLGFVPEGRQGEWLQLSCPLQHLHARKSDNKPSCGISIDDEGESIVNCFTCGSRTLFATITALQHIQEVSDDAKRFYLENEILKEKQVALEYKDKFKSSKIEQPNAVPDILLELFNKPKGKAKEYLESRGIDVDIATNLRQYQDKIVALIKDTDYKTYWLQYRTIQGKKFRYLRPQDFNLTEKWGRKDSWYNIEKIDFDKPVIVVEGAFDCERLRTLGVKNVIASHGPIGKNSRKIERLKRAKLVYSAFDADKAGKLFTENLKRKLECQVIRLDWSKVGCKDAGEIKSREDFDKVWQFRHKNTLIYRDKFTKMTGV